MLHDYPELHYQAGNRGNTQQQEAPFLLVEDCKREKDCAYNEHCETEPPDPELENGLAYEDNVCVEKADLEIAAFVGWENFH